MGPSSHNHNQPRARGLRGVIVAENDGQIRCAGSQAEEWLKKYFRQTVSPKRLPLSINRWLRTEAFRGRPLEVQRDGGHLVITLVKGERKGPHCLLLEENHRTDYSSADEDAQLTNRELEVLFWVAQGKANWAIGKILNLSPGTVRKHLQNIYCKLGVENRTAAAFCALETLHSLGQELNGFSR